MGPDSVRGPPEVSDHWPDLLGNVALDLGVCPRPAPTPNMRDPAIYLDVFAMTLHFASFPHPSGRPLVAAARPDGKIQAWEWIRGQAREGVRNPEWPHKESADKIGIIFSQLFHSIGVHR